MKELRYREAKTTTTIIDGIEELGSKLIEAFQSSKVLICDNLYVSERKVLKLNKCLKFINF